MKKLFSLLLIVIAVTAFSACEIPDNVLEVFGIEQEQEVPEQIVPDIELQITKMENICELAVMDCYFNNVAKYYEQDVEGFWLWEKDKKFWIEYSGIVSIGVDASQIKFAIEGDDVTITMPRAEILSSKVDETTLSEDSFIIDKDSAEVLAEDQTAAFAQAQEKMLETARANKSLFTDAEAQVQALLSDYIENIGKVTMREYEITWVFIEPEVQAATPQASAET